MNKKLSNQKSTKTSNALKVLVFAMLFLLFANHGYSQGWINGTGGSCNPGPQNATSNFPPTSWIGIGTTNPMQNL